MRTRIIVALAFVTSTTVMNEMLASSYPIEVHDNTKQFKPKINAKSFAFYNKWGESPLEGYISKRKVHRFMERFFPKNESQLDGLLKFKKQQHKSFKLRIKKAALCGDAALKVAS